MTSELKQSNKASFDNNYIGIWVTYDGDVPDQAYFRIKDCEPIVEYTDDGDILTVRHGWGHRRSWGSPVVSTKVVLRTE